MKASPGSCPSVLNVPQEDDGAHEPTQRLGRLLEERQGWPLSGLWRNRIPYALSMLCISSLFAPARKSCRDHPHHIPAQGKDNDRQTPERILALRNEALFSRRIRIPGGQCPRVVELGHCMYIRAQASMSDG